MSLLLPQNPMLIAFILIVTVPLAAFFLRQACTLCGADMPSYARSFVQIFLVAPTTYIVLDMLGYAIMRSFSDAWIQRPEDYSYGEWLGESFALKWEILGLVPGMRYLPVVVGICIAGILQVLILTVSFRIGVGIIIIQGGMTGAAFAALAFLASVVQGVPDVPAEVASEKPVRLVLLKKELLPGADQIKDRFAGMIPTVDDKGKVSRLAKDAVPPNLIPTVDDRRNLARVTKDAVILKPPETKTVSVEKDNTPAKEEKKPARESPITTALENARPYFQGLRDELDPCLETVKDASAPWTDRLPRPIFRVLNGGGWWLIIGLLTVGSGFWVHSIYQRIRRLQRGTRRSVSVKGKTPSRAKTKKILAAGDLHIDLGTLPETTTSPGPERLMVKGLPARVRLIILAPAGKDLDDLEPEVADAVLDWIRPGLSAIVAHDAPQVRVWGRQYSAGGFPKSFHFNVHIPDPPGQRSHWALVSGTVEMGRQRLHVGLVLFTDEPCNIRNVTLPNDQWLDMITVRA